MFVTFFVALKCIFVLICLEKKMPRTCGGLVDVGINFLNCSVWENHNNLCNEY